MDRQTVIDRGTLLLTCNHSKVRYYAYNGSVWAVFKATKYPWHDIAYLRGQEGVYIPKSL